MAYCIVNLEGRLVAEPLARESKNGQYCTFCVAVNLKHGQEKEASFYNCTCWGTQAEYLLRGNLSKGTRVHVAGELALRPYENRDGEKRVSAEVTVLRWDRVSWDNPAEDAGDGGYSSRRSHVPGDDEDDEDELPI